MTLNLRLFTILTAIAIAVYMITTSALAVGNSGTTKPGWGYGDKNHVHTGPPGLSVSVRPH